MARKPNYAFERNARASAKAAKREAKRQAKVAASEKKAGKAAKKDVADSEGTDPPADG